jgi:hypothetical protein
MMGDWVVKNKIAKGIFGYIYAIIYAYTGKAAVAKEL